ncbi:MAG: AraC family transcriptional regulator, partial [Bacteroidetes bacterium]
MLAAPIFVVYSIIIHNTTKPYIMFSEQPIALNYQHQRFQTSKKSLLPERDAFIKKVRHLIQINFDNELFDAACLASKVHLSVSQLNRKLNTLIQQPAGQLIWEMKMAYAAELLTKYDATIGEIAFQVGYKNQAHFCRSFKRRYG